MSTPKRKVSLYIHVPYCVKKCAYCDFNSYGGSVEADHQAYVAAVIREMQAWAPVLAAAGVVVPTVFVGGGTPSLLSGPLLERLIRAVGEQFSLAPDVEFTMEANPGTIDVADDKLARAHAAGANRISFGVQAFQPALLERLGRVHTPEQVEQSVHVARQAGFQNLNLDLMYGLPGQSPQNFAESLHRALSLGPQHISAYSLIVEPGTPFMQEFEAGQLQLPPEEWEEAMWDEAGHILVQAGMRHYEISNYARPGYESRHNQVYWRNEEYLGLGCGSHSFLLGDLGQAAGMPADAPPGAGYRCWNVRAPREYVATVAAGDSHQGPAHVVIEGEVVAPRAQMSETMMLGLRLLDGVSEERFRMRFDCEMQAVFGAVLAEQQARGLMERIAAGGAHRWRLTPRGLRLGNQVWAEFI